MQSVLSPPAVPGNTHTRQEQTVSSCLLILDLLVCLAGVFQENGFFFLFYTFTSRVNGGSTMPPLPHHPFTVNLLCCVGDNSDYGLFMAFPALFPVNSFSMMNLFSCCHILKQTIKEHLAL